MTETVSFIPQPTFDRVWRLGVTPHGDPVALLAEMCRLNALSAVKLAGSGHLGSSFSAMDIVTLLYYEVMSVRERGIEDPERDVYFSSKGHDAPGLYSVLFSLGVIPWDRFVRLRRLGGLDGHPDVGIPGVEASSGSLGMGISKGRGIAWAKRHLGRAGRVYVMTGDGELQEGQIYESLQSTVQQGIANLTVIVDHNKVQSDSLVSSIVDLGDLPGKFRAFGWHAVRCDGHDLTALRAALRECQGVGDRPQVIVADTIKGRGVSFMEHPRALAESGGLYRWHAGAPPDDAYEAALGELSGRIAERLRLLGVESELVKVERSTLAVREADSLEAEPSSLGTNVRASMKEAAEYVADAFGDALAEAGARRPDLVVLDADLAADCRLRAFATRFPERFIENGIAEQDMVSMAGGLARWGLLPVVNSFAAFLTSRANEQLYNNGCEGSRIIYVSHFGGLIPAGPGKSHQSLRDIGLVASLPGIRIYQPCNAAETRMILDHCVDVAEGSCVIRLAIGPSPRRISLPAGYRFTAGRGAVLKSGSDTALVAYGPVLLHEALSAAEALDEVGVSAAVVNLPCLNRLDEAWVLEVLGRFETLWVLDDHAPVGGLGSAVKDVLFRARTRPSPAVVVAGVEGYPACGTPAEVLAYHGLDGASLARRILAARQTSGLE